MLTSRPDKCILAVGTSWRNVYMAVVGHTGIIRINFASPEVTFHPLHKMKEG
jgi:hypothetical protein